MYDEINDDNIEGTVHSGGNGGEPNPENVNTYDSIQPESSTQTEPVEEQSGFYHYSYDKSNAQQEDTNYNNSSYSDYSSNPQSYPDPKPRKSGTFRKFAVCAGLAVVFGVVGSTAFQITDYVGARLAGQETEAIESKPTTADVAETESKAQAETAAKVVNTGSATDVSAVVEETMPSIVAITNIGVEEVQDYFFGRSYMQETESAGSGVIISQNESEILIATNNHVVEGAETLTVCFSVETENSDDLVVQAQIKGTDSGNDLAVIAVNIDDISEDVMRKIKVVQIGDSGSLKAGQQVIAIGNALGYGQSVTVGYISALDREVTVENVTNNLIQTDAAINAGNSGGALLNAAGELIGINSVKTISTGVEGIGYAIPMELAEPILGELMNRTTRTKVEEAEKGYMGITPVDVSDEAREIYSMPAGAFVYEVTEDSAAAQAGIVKGDIIVKLDGVTITSKAELFSQMAYYGVGETIEVVVASAEGGEYKERTVSLTLGEKPVDATATEENETQEDQGREGYDPFSEDYGYGDDDSSWFTFPN